MNPIDSPPSSRKRKFLIVYCQSGFWSMGKGSGAGSFWRTPTALLARGHEVHMVLPAEPGSPGGFEVLEGLQLHRYRATMDFKPPPHAPLPSRLVMRFVSYFAYQRIGTRSALEVAREIGPDLVLGFGASEAPVAHRVAREIGAPNVTRLFGTALALVLNDPIKYALAFPEVIAFRTPCARLILTNDGADGERVARRCGLPPSRFVHLRNGLDFDLFSPGAEDPSIRRGIDVRDDAPLVMTVTRLAAEKKLERVVDAIPSLLRRVPDAVTVFLGDGPERDHIKARARALGVAHAIRMPGAIANRDLPPWYRAASVVLSVLDRTNASNPVFEAMACEGCVLALDAGTTREVVVDGRTGVLLDRRDLPELGGRIADLILDPARRRILGKEARAHVRGLLLDPAARMDLEVSILLQVIEEHAMAKATATAEAASKSAAKSAAKSGTGAAG